jgi:Mannosyltransferase (PIG-V)
LLVLAVAVLAAQFGIDSSGEANEANFDDPSLTHPFHGLAGDLLSPLARWDAAWYLDIAHDGYDGGLDTAFFPLYPLLVRALVLPFASEGALLVSAYVVSLACFLCALWLLHRLAELELGRGAAGASVWLLALFPAAVYFGAPYSESLFLLASVGAFYAARTQHWALAGAAGAAASATRSAGLVLLVPLVLMWLGSQRRRLGELMWLGVAPLGLAAYAFYLEVDHGDAFAFLDAQDAWYREFAGPFVGVWDGAVAAWHGDSIDIVLFGFLVFAAVALVGTFRRLPLAYGVYALAALALPLSFPVDPQPLMSLPRFVAVLFPLFIWLGLVTDERGRTVPVAAVSAVGLAAFTERFASWDWIS